VAVDSDGPTALVLTRQSLPVLEGTAGNEGVQRGGYVLVEADGAPDLVLVGTGSEVHVCVEAARLLAADGVATRVVSLPSWELFAKQDEAYRESVLPPGVARLAVEAASPFGWERYSDDSVTIDRFGASAPGKVALENLGFTPANVAVRARALLTKTKGRSS
jgi:transketolase